MASGSTYKIVELVGSSSEGVQQAIDGAISRAAQTIRNLDWFEVREIRGTIDGGSANWYQVTRDWFPGRLRDESAKTRHKAASGEPTAVVMTRRDAGVRYVRHAPTGMEPERGSKATAFPRSAIGGPGFRPRNGGMMRGAYHSAA